MVNQKKLAFFIKHGYNALFTGKHGVGKTSMILEAFEEAGLNYRYFSASTMDPWVDFIGVPKEKEEDNETFLDLVRPRDFQDDSIQAIFMDEYNRAHKKVRNAVMELIQFKSINGRKFENLKIIWAAVNPEDDSDETYDVEPLDPAQKDRFHVHINIPYKPSKKYFHDKYGEKIARAALDWWHNLPTKELKNLVSPRRLDYALNVHLNNGDIEDVLNHQCNIKKLKEALVLGPVKDELKKLHQKGDKQAAKVFIANENNYAACIEHIKSDKDLKDFFIPLLTPERLSVLMSKDTKMIEHILFEAQSDQYLEEVCKDILENGQNRKVISNMRECLRKMPHLNPNKTGSSGPSEGVVEPFFRKRKKASDYDAFLGDAASFVDSSTATTHDRRAAYDIIKKEIPEQMHLPQAEGTLSIISEIYSRSQAATIKMYMTDIAGIINHAISEIHRHTGDGYVQIAKKYRDDIEKIEQKSAKIDSSHKIFRPQPKSISNIAPDLLASV